MSPQSGARAVPKYKIKTFQTKHETSPVTQYYRPLTETNKQTNKQTKQTPPPTQINLCFKGGKTFYNCFFKAIDLYCKKAFLTILFRL